MSDHIFTINFHGDFITVVVKNEIPHVALKPIVESLGLGWSQQLRTLKNDIVLSTCVTTIVTQVGGQRRKMQFLPLKFLNGWLFKINARNYSGERQKRLVEYQRECYEVLSDYFMNGGAINPEASPVQLQVMEGRINYYRQFLPKEEKGIASTVTGNPRIILVRSYYRGEPAKRHAPLQPDLFVAQGS